MADTEIPPKPLIAPKPKGAAAAAAAAAAARLNLSNSVSSASLPVSQSEHSLSNIQSLSSQSAPQSPMSNPSQQLGGDPSASSDNTSASSSATSSSEPVASDLPLTIVGSTSSISSSTVSSAFKEAPQQAKAVLRQHGGGLASSHSKQQLYGAFNKSSAEEPPADPATCEVKPGKETVLEINKDKLGLGLSIVGGSDTLLVNSRLTHFFFFLSKFRLKLRSTFISLTDSLYSSIKKKMFPGRYLDPRGLPGRRCRQRQEVEAGRPNPGRQRRELPQRHSQPSLDRSKTDTRQGIFPPPPLPHSE